MLQTFMLVWTQSNLITLEKMVQFLTLQICQATDQAMKHKEFDECSHIISTVLLVVYIGKMQG